MSNNKQSSVEWLAVRLKEKMQVWNSTKNYQEFHIVLEAGEFAKLFEQAKEMHQEEIDESYRDGFEFALINECAEQSTSDASQYSEGYKEGYQRALDYMADTIKNKIEVMENANNEFKKGTANTTGTTFLCTEFVSDQLFYKGTLPHCMRCGKPQYQHPIITNTI